MGIYRLGYVQLRVTDLERAVAYYTNVVGLLETGRQPGMVYLKCWDEHDHHSIVLRESDSPGADRFAFKAENSEDLEIFEKRLEARGVRVKRRAEGESYAQGESLAFESPGGHTVEVYYRMEKVGNGLPFFNPDILLLNLKGIAPQHTDHILVTSPDPKQDLAFYQEVFDFHLTEQVVDFDGSVVGGFLERSHTPHDIAIYPGRAGGFHHVAFWVESWHEVARAADILTVNRIPIDAGPTRHNRTRGYTTYFFDPFGNRNEVFTGGYLPDRDNQPISWSIDTLGTFYWQSKA